jgi:competence protein ComEC
MRGCVDSRFGSALLTGDIEAGTESLLVYAAGIAARRVLLVPHHGSRTSSTIGFIRAVAPAIAVVGCGYRNRFGHPRPDIVARYTNNGIRVVRTDLEGAITLTFAASQDLAPASARAERARYWLDTPASSPPSIE